MPKTKWCFAYVLAYGDGSTSPGYKKDYAKQELSHNPNALRVHKYKMTYQSNPYKHVSRKFIQSFTPEEFLDS